MVRSVTKSKAQGHALLAVGSPRAVTGSPLTKIPGEFVPVTWAVRNSGNLQGIAEIYLTNRTTGAARFLRSGPLAINANADVPVSLLWNTSGVAPGTYSITIALDEVTSGGGFVRNIAAEDSVITLLSPPITRPTDAEIIATAQAPLLVNTGIGIDSGFWDTRFFIGLTLLDLGLLVATVQTEFGLLLLDRDFIRDLPGASGWTWQQGLDWWKTSGLMKGLL